jgi:hypothetical protein
MALDDETLRAMLAAAPPGPWRTMQSYAGPWWVGRTGPCGCQRPDCDQGFTVVDDEHGAALAAAAPALAAEVLRLRAERDVLRHERDEHAHKAGEWEESHDIELARAERVEAAARAHLAAADAFSTACRTAAADVPAACARADAARECLAGLVGYVGEVAL